MLDYIPPYDPKVARPLSEEDKELESDLNYSRYKDLVDHARTGGNIINNKIPIISNSQRMTNNKCSSREQCHQGSLR